MKIDRVYIVCTKSDLYFARVAIASIRYWNKLVPVTVIKDDSNGSFDTSELEENLAVNTCSCSVSSPGYYAKLYPFMDQDIPERVFIQDADIVWLCDMVQFLEKYEEAIVVDGYSPANVDAEMQRWYFKNGFKEKFPNYTYPGFLFNVGQMLCNTSLFEKTELGELLAWKNNPEQKEDVFFYEQGILNYLLAKKIKAKSASYRLLPFHRWGWDEAVSAVKTTAIAKRQATNFLIHWYGKKNGLLSFLPNASLLHFYEKFYYAHLSNGTLKMAKDRFARTVQHPVSFLYESGKKVYYFFAKRKT